MKTLLTTTTLTLCVLGTAAMTGCKTDNANVSKNPITGSVYRTVQASPPEVADAAETVFNDMGLFEVDAKATRLDAQITGRTADETLVTVWAGKGETGTDVYAKYGTWSDPAQAQTILEEISQELGEAGMDTSEIKMEDDARPMMDDRQRMYQGGDVP